MRRMLKSVVFAWGLSLALGAGAESAWKVLPIYGGGRILDVFFTRNPQVLYAVSDVGGSGCFVRKVFDFKGNGKNEGKERE